jgi:ubiquinone/menaquinone biosynthesis C-methylase UbiE
MDKKKITKPRKSEENKLIFTEGINYFKTGKTSIWGKGNKITSQLLKKIKIHGKWLNLASGDGRYNLNLLRKVDSVIASDIDASALSKLWHNTPQKHREKLDTKVFDITKRLPFKDGSFDGVFCTGTLHFFPKKTLRKIISEIDRVLKSNGKVILDFATDVSRTSSGGKLITFGNEPRYSLVEAKRILKHLFKNYRLKLRTSEVIEDFQGANPPYKLNCKFVLLIADKRSVRDSNF